MKIISRSKLMPICVYTDQQVCMYLRMNRWMDARIYIRNIGCNERMCVEVCVYMCGDMYSIFAHMNLSVRVYMCNTRM